MCEYVCVYVCVKAGRLTEDGRLQMQVSRAVVHAVVGFSEELPLVTHTPIKNPDSGSYKSTPINLLVHQDGLRWICSFKSF